MLDVELATACAPPPAALGARAFAADDPAARALLRRAQGAFQKWPEGFCGFRASVHCETSRGWISGRLAFAPPDRIEIECGDPGLRAWLREMVRSIAADRTPRFFADGDGRFPVSFCSAVDDATGRGVDVHCPPVALRYWIDGRGRIARTERIADGLRAVTTFDELTRATPGRVLPARTTTSTWDLSTGVLIASETAHDSHRRFEHVWLPTSRRVSVGSGPSHTSLELTLNDHELL